MKMKTMKAIQTVMQENIIRYTMQVLTYCMYVYECMYVCMYVHSRPEAGLNLNVYSSVIYLCTIYVCMYACVYVYCMNAIEFHLKYNYKN